jgi:hypothetical protein
MMTENVDMTLAAKNAGRSCGTLRAAFAVLLFQQVATASSAPQMLDPPPKGTFAARLFLTDDPLDPPASVTTYSEYSKFIDAYAAGGKVHVADNTISRGSLLRLMHLVSGCTPDANGLCNVTATLTLFQPSGKIEATYFSGQNSGSPNLEIIVAQPPPPAGQWKMATSTKVISFFDPKTAPTGDYLALSVFTDHNRPDTQLTTWQIIRVTD